MENHFYIPQIPVLKDAVELFWQFSGTNCRKEIIIPKGGVEIIFNFYENKDFYAQIGTQTYQVPLCFISSYNSSPIQHQVPDKQIFFGVKFTPTTFKKILGITPGEFANRCVDITLVNNSFNSLWHQLAEQKTFGDRVTIVSDWLKTRISRTTAQEQMFNKFLNNQTDKILSVSELSERLCYSSRHLSRKLYELTGMNTEETLLYKKYLQSVFLIHHSKLSLSEIAHACQFADQSHFSKTFKSFAWITPSKYKSIKSDIDGHIFKNTR